MTRALLAGLAAVALGAGAAQYAVGATEALWLANVSWTAAAAFAVGGAAVAVTRVAAGARRPWAYLLAASVAWLLGQLGWDAVHLFGGSPSLPSALDAAWLAFAFLAAAGLYRLSPAPARIRRIAQLEAGALVAVAAALVAALVWTALETTSLGDAAAGTATAYAVVHVALAATVAQALLGAPRAFVSPGLLLVFAGVVLEAVAFAAWTPALLGQAYVTGGNAIDGLWTAGMLLLGAGGLVADRTPPIPSSTDRDLRWRVLLPWTGVLASVGAGIHLAVVDAPLEPRLALLAGLALAGSLLFARAWFTARLYRDLLADVRASEGRFALAVEATRDGIWDHDLLRGTAYFSPRWKAILGYAADELDDTPAAFDALVHPDDLPAVRNRVDAAIGAGHPYEAEFRMRHRDGSYRTIHSRGVVGRDERGRAVRMTGSHADVTDLRQARSELERSNRDLEAFAYTASHDLRAPLVSIEGFAHALRRSLGDALDDRSTHYLQRISSNAAALQRLIRDLLDYARLGIGDGGPEVADANGIAAEVVETFRARLDGADAAVVLASALPPVRAQPVHVKQALVNLVENAVQHGRGERPLSVAVSGAVRDGMVEIAVEDNGPGVAPEAQPRMFELFERGRDARERAPEGTGVGLAIVKKIADSSGGSLRYEDVAGGGSRFVLALAKGVTP